MLISHLKFLGASSAMLLLVVPSVASAESGSEPDSTTAAEAAHEGWHADVEVDPLAFALRGYSLHVGIGYRKLRVDLGAFAAELPGFIHGNEGFDAAAHGFTVKLHYFPFDEQKGFFAGVDGVFSQLFIERQSSELAVRRNLRSVGVVAGYRFMLPAGFYVTPWLAVSYETNAADVTLGGRTFESGRLGYFATFHLGYRFF